MEVMRPIDKNVSENRRHSVGDVHRHRPETCRWIPGENMKRRLSLKETVSMEKRDFRPQIVEQQPRRAEFMRTHCPTKQTFAPGPDEEVLSESPDAMLLRLSR